VSSGYTGIRSRRVRLWGRVEAGLNPDKGKTMLGRVGLSHSGFGWWGSWAEVVGWAVKGGALWSGLTERIEPKGFGGDQNLLYFLSNLNSNQILIEFKDSFSDLNSEAHNNTK
jgi:hypothetical protein